MSKVLKTAWDFVEEWYPNYFQSDEIANNNDLEKLINGEYDHNDAAHQLLKSKYENDLHHPQLFIDYKHGLIQIYEAAIENFLTYQSR